MRNDMNLQVYENLVFSPVYCHFLLLSIRFFQLNLCLLGLVDSPFYSFYSIGYNFIPQFS